MTLQQALAFGILGITMGLFVWGRLRYDLVALIALLASVVAGVVPASKAFSGFSDDIVVIVGSVLVVSTAVAQSGIVTAILRPIAGWLTTTRRQILVLVPAVTVLSAVVKNIGALALLMPVAVQLARKAGTPASHVLMPLAFGSLLGGLMTLIGTSPNIIVSRVRTELLGKPFDMFDFAPVGIGIACAGVAFLTIGYRLLPAHRKGAASIDAAFNIEGYTTEARVPEGAAVIDRTVAALEALGGEVKVATIVREQFRRYTPTPEWTLLAGDVLILEGEPEALEQAVARGGLELVGTSEAPEPGRPGADIGVVEGVVTAGSALIGRTAAQLGLRERHQVNLVAISRSGERIAQRLRQTRLRAGDVVMLQGNVERLPEILGDLGVLPLAERALPLGRERKRVLPALVLVAALALVATHAAPIAIAMFGAAVVLMTLRAITLRDAYEAVDWPILVLLGALIPVSDAIQATGGTDLIAGWLSQLAERLPPAGALVLIMVAAMAVTPFLNNAATVLVMAPIGASFAGKLHLNPDPFLMAVAIGAACDFLTPIGHQCNTLVMGPGGYRFGDYARLGLPLSITVIVVGTPLIAWFWPLAAR